MKATLVLRKDKVNKKKFCPINIRIISKGVISYISTSISIHKDHWDLKKQLVKNKSILAQDINRKLQDDLTAMNKILLSHYDEYSRLNANEIKEALLSKIKGEDRVPFFEEADRYIEKFKTNRKIGTYDDRLSKIKQLKEFNHNIEVDKINAKLVMGFKDFLEEKGNCNPETIFGKIKFFKTLYRHYCHKFDYPRNDNAFNIPRPKAKENIKFLDETQIEAFEKLKTETAKQELYKSMFEFVINGIGLRISDILTLKWTHIDDKNSNINKVSYKTRKTLNVRIPVPAMEIAKKLKTPESSPYDYVFPILDDKLEDLTDPEILDDAISRETSSYNKFLRKCGEKIGLSFNLSSHKGRHTYATKALSKGLELHYVQHTLGHQSIKETEIYAKVVKKSVNEAVDKYLSN